MKLAESYAKATIIDTFVKDGKAYAKIKEKCDRCGGSGIFFVGIHNGEGVPSPQDNGVCYKCNGKGTMYDEVRMYEDDEYERMMTARKRLNEKRAKKFEEERAERLAQRNLQTLHNHGFVHIDAYVVLGDTYDIKDQLKEAGAKFSYELHWVCPEEPTWLTDHKYVKITVADVFKLTSDGVFELKENAAEFIKSFEPKTGRYLGAVGSKITVEATLVRCMDFDSQFGWRTQTTYVHVFETADKDVVVWKTTTARLETQKTYVLTGTIKEHSEYNNVRQTVLTRCKYIEGGPVA